MRRLAIAVVTLVLAASPAAASVTRVAVSSRATVAGGQAFGLAGPYEKITGTVFFEIDPADPRNRAIADIDLAPKNARGLVEFSADLFILAPKDAARASGSMLFEISNRGGKGLLTTFNRGVGSPDPSAPEHFGDGLLMRHGFMLVWVGWEFDVGPLPQMSVKAPTTGIRQPVEGVVTTSFVVDASTAVASLTDVALYHPVDPREATAALTVRDSVWDAPTMIPRAQWHFVTGTAGDTARCSVAIASCPRVSLASGFEAGRIYEVKYRAVNPPVAGVGLAAVRDVASAFKHRDDMPIRGRYAHVFGSSQSGRFLRQFLYDGFNEDEQGLRVFDGMMPHIAGAARGTFNQRFSQAVGLDQFHALRFPFADTLLADPLSARKDGLTTRYATADLRPRIIYTNSSVEYWGTGRAAALTHTSPDGATDLVLPDNVRIYHFAGTQHGPAPFPPTALPATAGPNSRGTGQQLGNPTPFTIGLRALLLSLDRWVRDGTTPPESRYSRLTDLTLTPLDQLPWPTIPGVTSPLGIPRPRRAQSDAPAGQPWPFLVPQVDADGNEMGGIRLPDISVPLGTSTGWNFRSPTTGNPRMIVPLLGSFVPFARTAADRERTKDPRRSVAERYASKHEYLGRVSEATLDLVRQGYLLREDTPFLLERAAASWDWITAPAPKQTARP